jgi:hypothetical protein
MYQHHEAMSPATSKYCWALLIKSPNGKTTVVASSTIISSMVGDISNDAEELDMPQPDSVGFWLWQGTSQFDGLDGSELVTETLEKLNYKGFGARLAMHEEPYLSETGYDISIGTITGNLFTKIE